MGESRGPNGSAAVDVTRRLVYWVIGLFMALLSVGRFPGISRTAPAEVAAVPAASPANVTPVAAGDGGAPLPLPEASRFLSRCLSRAAHAECCDGWRLLDEYRRLYDPSLAADGTNSVGGSGVQFRHLIATVPDPVESGHGDLFDGVLEGVEEAVAQGADGVTYVR